uniref:glycosyltransferase family 2 protein n=1 Tax=Brachyspira innocens TaxID=13264 RepID=UPI0026F0625E
MKKISVIVPVYNREKYIARCLDYLINQTYKNIEIIVIDDCSTDNSASIVKDYADKYDNIIFIQNKENKKTFETKSVINENNWPRKNIKNILKYYNGEVLYDLLNMKLLHTMPASLFKKEIIKNALKDVNNYIRLAHAEDFLWRVIIYFYIKKSIHSNKELYNYCKNMESVSHSKFECNTFIKRIIDYSIMLDELKKILLLHNSYENMKNIYFYIVNVHAKNSFNSLKSNNKDYIYIWQKNASENLKIGLILYYESENDKFKKENDKFKKEINIYKIINTRINIADIIFSISWDNNYIIFMIIGIKIRIKKDNFVKK